MRIGEVSKALSDEDKARIHKAMGVNKDANVKPLVQLARDKNKGVNKDVEEASDWGEPREILEDVLQTLEREVEWPLTEVMDPKEVQQLLSPIIRAVNDKLLSMEAI